TGSVMVTDDCRVPGVVSIWVV
ncbi:MAG: hypothetical protein JWM59_1444, partial [Verrucomicrobiales bacterium]|nr:hypothetical protein [Verrucomicrobiales bacterium]